VIAGIGVDMCEVDRMRRVLEASHGRRFRDRVFTDAEQAYCEARRRGRFESYAARFAVKESVMKVLGTGWSRGVSWRDIETVRAPGEAPALRLHGRAAAIARRRGMTRWLVSVTHTRAGAIAWVVAEGSRLSGRPSGAAAAAGRSRPRARPGSR
jgi:holo-[acyl-carrier protein] synthase